MASQEYNYTCLQCYRMTYSLQDMCQATSGNSVDNVRRYQDLCEADTLPVAHGDGPSRRWYKCGAFYQFVKELYCPYDPCVQVSIQSNRAHHAICGLLRCEGFEEPLPELKNPEYTDPLPCPNYVERIIEECKGDPSKEISDLCSEPAYAETFSVSDPHR